MSRPKLKNRSTSFVVFLAIILFFYTFNVTTSRYIAKIKAEEDLLAVPIITLDKGLTYIIEDMLPGDSRECEFIVSNKESNKINEILLDYDLLINLEPYIPITLTLYDITDGNESLVSLSNGKTTAARMNYGTETTKSYRIKLNWDEKENDYKYAGQQLNINIELNAVQVTK